MNRLGVGFFFLACSATMAGLWAFGGCGNDNNGAPAGDKSDAGHDTGTFEAGDEDDAGPPSCITYCNLVAAHCFGDVRDADVSRPTVATAQYLSTPGCEHACADMPLGEAGAEEGDSVACRQYHAGVPAGADPVTHCPHASIAGGGMCSGPTNTAAQGRCVTFCKYAIKLCAPAVLADAGLDGAVIPFADEGACLDACGQSGLGRFDFDPNINELAANGNSLNCREYHLSAAYNDLPDDAGHAAPSAITECPKLRPSAEAGAPTLDNPCSSP